MGCGPGPNTTNRTGKDNGRVVAESEIGKGLYGADGACHAFVRIGKSIRTSIQKSRN